MRPVRARARELGLTAWHSPPSGTGRYTAEAKAERWAARALIRELRRLMDAGDSGDRLCPPMPLWIALLASAQTRSTLHCLYTRQPRMRDEICNAIAPVLLIVDAAAK
jgi:hypothetical protein